MVLTFAVVVKDFIGFATVTSSTQNCMVETSCNEIVLVPVVVVVSADTAFRGGIKSNSAGSNACIPADNPYSKK
jgi:hypothetical protein